MPLSDAHVVEAILAVIGAIDAPARALVCRNCGQEGEVFPARALPIEPLLAPPGDAELDPSPVKEIVAALPRPIAVGRARRAVRFRLAPRTLGDRARLVRLVGRGDEDDPPPLPVDAPLVRALGLSFVDERGAAVGSPIAIARALDRLDDDAFEHAWSAIAEAFDRMHYPPRLLAPVACPACGARHDVEVLPRPILPSAPRRKTDESPPFPAIDAFRALAASIAREVMTNEGFDERAGIEVIVDDDVPPCDDGGEPLLGSYTPRDEGGDLRPASPFEIALYYRSFRAMFAEEPYDVAAEVRETLEHELEHHQGFLAGNDPLDDEEREEIAREHARLHGKKKSAPRALAEGTSWLAGDVGRFLRATWPIWVIVLGALLILAASSR